jgi:hypothetical protein
MRAMRLVQSPPGRRWQTFRGIDSGCDSMDTQSMGNCVCAVAIADKDVRGYHGSGGIDAINFEEIRKEMPDTQQSKLVVVFSQDSLEEVQRHIQGIIKKHGFKNWQWELYKSPHALIRRDGTVLDAGNKAPIQRQRVFISNFAHLLK